VGAARSRDAANAEPLTVHDNRVNVTGRVSSAALSRTMPSGDEMVTWRVVVDRPPGRGHGPAFDVVDCVAWGARVRRAVLGWSVGDIVALDGALRRRFWRSPGGLQSRCEIEVRTARRVATSTGRLKRRRKPA
jgi:single-strand DNA-binding protein